MQNRSVFIALTILVASLAACTVETEAEDTDSTQEKLTARTVYWIPWSDSTSLPSGWYTAKCLRGSCTYNMSATSVLNDWDSVDVLTSSVMAPEPHFGEYTLLTQSFGFHPPQFQHTCAGVNNITGVTPMFKIFTGQTAESFSTQYYGNGPEFTHFCQTLPANMTGQIVGCPMPTDPRNGQAWSKLDLGCSGDTPEFGWAGTGVFVSAMKVRIDYVGTP